MHCSESYISPFNECPGWCWLQISKNCPIKYPTYINMYAHTCINIKKTHHIIPYHNIPIIYHAYIYMYHVLSPVYPVYPHTIASHMFVCMYVCMHVYPISHCISIVSALWLVMYHPVLVTSVLSSFIIYRGFLKWWIPKPWWLSILKWSSRTGWNGGTHHDFGNLHISCSLVTTINH